MRTTKRRKMYARIEKVGNVMMVSGTVGLGISLLNPVFYIPSAVAAYSDCVVSLIGERKLQKDDIALGNYEINKKTRKLVLKK